MGHCQIKYTVSNLNKIELLWSLDSRVTLINNNKSEFSIQIDRVTVYDEGPYTCSFQARDEPRTAHVYLIVQVPAKIINISKDISVNEGSNVNLFCLAIGRPEPTVTWRHLKYLSFTMSHLLQPIAIPHVLHQENIGVLCIFTKINTDSEEKSMNKKLCLFCFKLEQRRGDLVVHNYFVIFKSFFRYGLLSEGEFLDITEIKRQQAEEYECITNNGVSAPDTRKVRITVNYPPVITDVKNMPAQLGKAAILRCEAMSVPTASFEWYKDEKRLVEHDSNVKIQNEKTRSLLMFTNVTAKHFGNYTCFASNRLGSSNSSMLLYSE
ncbi:IGLO5 protein, partial [Atractosteus spatula]|nr:IGLO5 protein [Atractosteus spatula]